MTDAGFLRNSSVKCVYNMGFAGAVITNFIFPIESH